MIFEVQSGDKTYEVDAPDQATAIKALQQLMQDAPKPAPPDPSRMAAGPIQTAASSTLGDVNKSIGSGLVTGTEGLLGLPGDMMQGAHDLGGWAGRNIRSLAGMPAKPADAPTLSNPAPLPTSGDVAGANNAVTGFTPYQPKTTLGKFANTAAEFVPGAMALGGSGGMVRKAIGYGVIPGIASEAAGQATEGTMLEGPARFAGAVVGGMVGGRFVNPKAATGPTAASVKAEGDAFYQSLKTPQGQLILEPSAFNRVVNDIGKAAYNERINPSTPKAMAILKEFENMAAPGVAPDLLEIEGLRRQLGRLAASPDKSEKFFAMLMKSKLDDAMNSLKPQDIIAGDANDALRRLAKGRELWRRSLKAETLDNLVERAKDLAGANSSANDIMTKMRQQLARIKRRPDFKATFTPAEREAITQIVRGTKWENAIRHLSKLDPRNPVMLSLQTILGFTGSPMMAATSMGAGYLAKGVATRQALGQMDRLGEMVASGTVPPPVPGANLPLAASYGQNTLNRDARLRLPPIPSEMASDPLGRRLGIGSQVGR